MRARPIVHLLALLAGSAALPALSAEGPAAVESVCVEVEVNGQRAPSFACLTQKLTPSASATNARTPSLASEAVVNRPSNQLGLFNLAATGHRMGNTYGTSVRPQRPTPTAPASPVIPRQ
jgi:hypothetical protein